MVVQLSAERQLLELTKKRPVKQKALCSAASQHVCDCIHFGLSTNVLNFLCWVPTSAAHGNPGFFAVFWEESHSSCSVAHFAVAEALLSCLLVLVFYVCHRNIQFHVRMEAVSKLMMTELMALSGTLSSCKIQSKLFLCGDNPRCMYKVWHAFVLQLCMSDVLLTPGGCLAGHSSPLPCWMPTLQQLLHILNASCWCTQHIERSGAQGW